MTTLAINMTLSTQLEQTPDAPTAPGLAVSGNVITVTLTSDPESYGEAITGRGVRYSTDGVNWTNAFLFTSGETIARSGETPLLYETQYFVQWRAANANGAGDWSSSSSITTEAEPAYVAPSLSSETASANGARSFSGSVTTNKAGTLYVYASTNASETEATILTSGTPQNVAAAGSVPFSGIGVLTPETTYYAHLAFTDGTNTDTATTASFTTAAQGVGTGTVTATIIRESSTERFAPHGIMLNIVQTGGTVAHAAANAHDPAYQHYTVVVDWGDSAAVSDKVRNVPAQWNQPNSGYGFNPGHVYANPGTYNGQVWVYEPDGTLVGTNTFSVTVTDPDTVFSGNKTILIDPANQGDPTNHPGAQVVTTWTAAYNAARNAALGVKTRVLAKRGSTTQIAAQSTFTGVFDNFYLGAWGPGTARPIIEIPANNSMAKNGTASGAALSFRFDSASFPKHFVGLEVVGPWNAETETGTQHYFIAEQPASSAAGRRLTVHDCTFRGLGESVDVSGTTTVNNTTIDWSMWVNNCDMTDWGNYGMYIGDNHANCAVSVTNTAIHQTDNALMGGVRAVTNNQHGPIRAAMWGRSYYDNLDLYSRNGWSPPIPTSQPCFRTFFSSPSSPSFYPKATLSRIAMEGGYACLQIKHMNAGGSGGALNLLMDKILAVATASTWHHFEVQWTGWTLRNFITVAPDQPVFNLAWRGVFFPFDLGVSRAQNPVEIYHGTHISLRSTSNLEGAAADFDEEIDGTLLANDYTQENCAIYQVSGPSEAIDVDLTTRMVTAGGVWTSRYPGTRWAAQPTLNTALANPADLVKTYIPGSSSPLVGDATTGLTAYDDFYGTVRSSPDRGAVERT
jgi:hypothetical protein